MTRVEFGLIVRSLREEKNWSRRVMEEQPDFNLTRYVINDIETKNSGDISPEQLIELAKVFRLTSSERQAFVLAAFGIDIDDIPRQQTTPEQTLTQILTYLEGLRLPCFIADNHCDIIRANQSAVTLLKLDQFLNEAEQVPAGYNAARIVFDEQYNYKELMGDQWEKHAIYNIRYFRERTLTSRHTPYYSYLMSVLSTLERFHYYWKEVEYDPNDYFSGHISYEYVHPDHGELKYAASETITITKVGNLSTIVYIPKSENTVAVFESIAQQHDNFFMKFASWPEKLLPPTQESS